MDKRDLVTISLIMGIAILAFMVGVITGVKTMQTNAIEAGVAHYTVNSTNGITQFKYKKP